MRVCQVVFGYPPAVHWGGPGAVVQALARAQSQAGHDVVVVATDRLNRTEMVPADPPDDHGVVVQRVRTVFVKRWPGSVGPAFPTPSGLIDMARQIRASDVVHVHGWRHLFSLAASILALVMRKPLFLQPHGGLDTFGGRAGIKMVFDRTFGRLIARFAASLLAITGYEEELADTLTKGRGTVDRVGNPAPPIRGNSQAAEASDAAPDVFYVGRFHHKKGVDILVDAWGILQSHHDVQPGQRLSIAGPDDGFRDAIVQQVAQLPDATSVELLGSLTPDERDERLQQFPIVVVPSKSDIFPMTILEAASFGCPLVVTTAVQISPELAGYAVLCEPDAASIAEAIVTALNAAEHYRSQSLRLAERYEASAVADQVTAVYTLRTGPVKAG